MWKFLLVVLIVPGVVGQTVAALPCLKYEPEVVEVRGKMKRVVFPGPPNYESVRSGDEPEPYYVLFLEKAVCVEGDPKDEISVTERDVKSMQLMITDYKKYRPLLEKNVTVKGKIMHSTSGHHHTKVLIQVQSITKTPNRSLVAQTAQPKTVVDYYLLLPDKYTIEVSKDRRQQLLRESGRIVAKDIKNGYLYISGDGGEAGIVMALFKRPDGSYLIGVNPYDEMADDQYFLSYDKGKWRDVGPQVVPEYGEDKVYELPRYGTTVEVYESRKAPGEDYRERGRKLYHLIWKNGAFTIERMKTRRP